MPIDIGAILDEIPIAVCLISKDCRIVSINRALEALTGFPGRNVKDCDVHAFCGSKNASTTARSRSRSLRVVKNVFWKAT
jgi:PAS domain-containing protein